MNIVLDLLKELWIIFKEIFKLILVSLERIDIPTSKYGLIEFMIKHNVIFFNSVSLTKIILFLAPLIVGLLTHYIVKKLRIRDSESKENINIILYLCILYVFSLWQFWLVIGIIVSIGLLILIIHLVNIVKQNNSLKNKGE